MKFVFCCLKVGGNGKAKAFFQNQADYREGMAIRDKYHTRAAALYKDKVSRQNEYIISIFP